MSGTVFYPRHVRGLFLESLQDSPAVVIHGPRQCGKTTLAQAVCAPERLHRSWRPAAGAAAGPTYAYITFDDDAARNAARAEPCSARGSRSRRAGGSARSCGSGLPRAGIRLP